MIPSIDKIGTREEGVEMLLGVVIGVKQNNQ